MIQTGKMIITAACAVVLAATARAVSSDDAGNPYQSIVDHNVFALRPAPKPDDPSLHPPPPPPVKVELNGIMTIFGKPQAMIKAHLPAHAPEPAKDDSYILSPGERDGDIEVVSIDPVAGTVKIKNQDVEQERQGVRHARRRRAADWPAPARLRSARRHRPRRHTDEFLPLHPAPDAPARRGRPVQSRRVFKFGSVSQSGRFLHSGGVFRRRHFRFRRGTECADGGGTAIRRGWRNVSGGRGPHGGSPAREIPAGWKSDGGHHAATTANYAKKNGHDADTDTAGSAVNFPRPHVPEKTAPGFVRRLCGSSPMEPNQFAFICETVN
jgi:hypothetical protein